MSNKEKFILAIAGLAIVLALSALAVSILKTSPAQIVDNVGSIGGLAIENYLPVIKHNEGYYSELPISLSGADGDLTISSLGTLTVSGTFTNNATSTVDRSYDGFVIQPTMTYATGTVNGLYTNTTGKAMMCKGGGVYADSLSTTLGRNFKVSMGTSTGVVGAGVSLIATTTVATSTDTFIPFFSPNPFMLANNESIIIYFADADANASSTYFTSTYWRVQPAIYCTLLGG